MTDAGKGWNQSLGYGSSNVKSQIRLASSLLDGCQAVRGFDLGLALLGFAPRSNDGVWLSWKRAPPCAVSDPDTEKNNGRQP